METLYISNKSAKILGLADTDEGFEHIDVPVEVIVEAVDRFPIGYPRYWDYSGRDFALGEVRSMASWADMPIPLKGETEEGYAKRVEGQTRLEC